MKKQVMAFVLSVLCVGCAPQWNIYYIENVPYAYRRILVLHSNGQFKDLNVSGDEAVVGDWIRTGDTIKIIPQFVKTHRGILDFNLEKYDAWPQKLYRKNRRILLDKTNYDSIHRVLKSDPDTLKSLFYMWDVLKSQEYKRDNNYNYFGVDRKKLVEF